MLVIIEPLARINGIDSIASPIVTYMDAVAYAIETGLLLGGIFLIIGMIYVMLFRGTHTALQWWMLWLIQLAVGWSTNLNGLDKVDWMFVLLFWIAIAGGFLGLLVLHQSFG